MKLKWLVCALICPVLSAEAGHAQTLDWATPYPALVSISNDRLLSP